MMTHTILRAAPSPEFVEECGPIAQDEAIALFRSFPFADELSKCALDPNLTIPTLTFHAVADTDSSLTIWSAEPGEYLVWVPEIFALVDRVTDPDDVADCIELFFDADLETLGIRIFRLEEKYG